MRQAINDLTAAGAVGGFRKNGPKVVGIVAITALLCMFFGSIGMGIVSKEFFGLFERISVFSIVVFTFTLGIFGFLQVNTKNSKE